jgi:hypothetical protein
MRPPQLKKLLDDAVLTQAAAAKLIDVDTRTMRRYVSGETPMPKVVELALLYVITRRVVSPERLEEAPRKLWQRASDLFVAAGGAAGTPSTAVLDERGRVHEVVFYKANKSRLARVPIGEDGKMRPVEWL